MYVYKENIGNSFRILNALYRERYADFSSRNNHADFSARVPFINDACLYPLSSSRPSHPPLLLPSSIPSNQRIHYMLISRYHFVSLHHGCHRSLSLSFLVSFMCPSFSFYSFHLCLLSPLFFSIICFASISFFPLQ